MNLDHIKTKADRLLSEIKKTDERRSQWNVVTKELIFNTLTEIKEGIQIETIVQKIEEFQNQEFINLQLKLRHSGIIETTKNDDKIRSKAFFIEGGYIVFTQAVNGKIYSIISYPFVEGKIQAQDALTIGLYEPSEINRVLIYKHVDIFFDEMIKWQNNYLRNPLGFKIS